MLAIFASILRRLLRKIKKYCNRKIISTFKGARTDSNRRHSEPQSDALTNWTTGTMLVAILFCGCKGRHFLPNYQIFDSKFCKKHCFCLFWLAKHYSKGTILMAVMTWYFVLVRCECTYHGGRVSPPAVHLVMCTIHRYRSFLILPHGCRRTGWNSCRWSVRDPL